MFALYMKNYRYNIFEKVPKPRNKKAKREKIVKCTQMPRVLRRLPDRWRKCAPWSLEIPMGFISLGRKQSQVCEEALRFAAAVSKKSFSKLE